MQRSTRFLFENIANNIVIGGSKPVDESAREWNALCLRMDTEAAARIAYRKYNQEEQDFLSSHPEDAADIRVCFDWLHEHSINTPEMIEKAKQHYKKLAHMLSHFQLESHDQPTTQTTFNTM